MYFLFINLSFPLISALITIIFVIIFTLYPKVSIFRPDYSNAIPVIDVLRALEKICPINSSNNWILNSYSHGSHRCWIRTFALPVSKSIVKLCGSATALNCSSEKIYSLIADVTKWADWNPFCSSQCVVKPFHDKHLKSDYYMEAEQIVSIIRDANKIRSHISMYRFHDFSENKVGWILLWNVKKLEFMFFLIQPTKSKNESRQCVLTHIMGSKSTYKSVASLVVQRIVNIQDFLSLSSLNLVPLKFASSVQSVDESPQEKADSSDKSSMENLYSLHSVKMRRREKHRTIFILIPFESSYVFWKTLDKFNLGVKNIDHAISITKRNADAVEKESKSSSKKDSASKGLIRRAASDVGIKPEVFADLAKCSEISKEKTDTLNCEAEEKMHPKQNSDTGEDSETKNIKIAQKLKVKNKHHRIKLRSLSETAIACLGNHVLPSLSDDHDNASEKKLEHISENVGDTLLAVDAHDYKEMFNSSLSDFEIVENSEFTENIIASFITQGNYGASELQAEVLLASYLEQDMNPGNFAGDWIFHSNYKGLRVLVKTTTTRFMKIISFLCQAELPIASKDVWKFVKNPQFRFICDETVKSVEVIERISNSQKLIHTYHEVGTFLKKELIDFCLLQTEREELSKYYSCFYSIEYDKCPFMNSVTRGTLRPSGWIVEEINGNSKTERSKVIYMLQVLVNSPDSSFIHELSILVPQSVHNLKNYITSKPV